MCLKDSIKDSLGDVRYTSESNYLFDMCYNTQNLINLSASIASFSMSLAGLFVSNRTPESIEKKQTIKK
jgi:hypothetical protein